MLSCGNRLRIARWTVNPPTPESKMPMGKEFIKGGSDNLKARIWKIMVRRDKGLKPLVYVCPRFAIANITDRRARDTELSCESRDCKTVSAPDLFNLIFRKSPRVIALFTRNIRF